MIFASAAQAVVDRMLFRGASPLPGGIVAGGDFEKIFSRAAPRSCAGHALKDLRLEGRLIAQRCSCLTCSESFRVLPETLKVRTLDRLDVALTSRDPRECYAYLPVGERERIRAILLETHPDARLRWSGK